MKAVKINTERLKECREKMGLSKNAAAKLINVSQPAYLLFESGKRFPTDQTVKTIALAFNTSVEYLTDQSTSPAPNSYYIEKTSEPVLFEIITESRTKSDEQLDRLLQYAKRL